MEISSIRGIEEAYKLASEDKELEKRDQELAEQKIAVRELLLKYCVNSEGNLDLSGLDFRHFNGDIDISGMQVKGNLIQSYQHVYGDLIQCNQEVEGNLDQSCQMVEFDNSRASAAGNDIYKK